MPLPYKDSDLQNIKELDIDQLNILVQDYQNGNKDLLATIVLQFHPLLHKYTRVLKGDRSPHLINYDTIQLLSLFLYGEDKNQRAANSVIAYMGERTSFLEEEDVYNDLVVLLLECLQEYEAEKGLNSLGFLTTRLRWKIRDWLGRKSSNNSTSYLNFDVQNPYRIERHDAMHPCEDMLEGANEIGFLDYLGYTDDKRYEGLNEMNLSWVQQTDDPLFRDLTVYERYLLYLYYSLDLSIGSIAEVLKRDKDTTRRHFNALMQELREMANFQ